MVRKLSVVSGDKLCDPANDIIAALRPVVARFDDDADQVFNKDHADLSEAAATAMAVIGAPNTPARALILHTFIVATINASLYPEPSEEFQALVAANVYLEGVIAHGEAKEWKDIDARLDWATGYLSEIGERDDCYTAIRNAKCDMHILRGAAGPAVIAPRNDTA